MIERKLGRPPNQTKIDDQQNTEITVEPTPLTSAETEHLAKRKRVRKPFGSHQQKLAYAERPGYHRHWFNDQPGRILRALDGGYEHVKDDQTGEPVRRVVGVQEGGGALYAYIMEIPEEWWKEDLAEAQKRVDEMDQAIKSGVVSNNPGDNRYIPNQGISIRRV